jgi:NADH-quinone oxidoreductase subunit I
MGIKQVPQPPRDSNIIALFFGYLTTIGAGLRMTGTIFFKQFLRLEKSNTLEWPEAPATYGPRFKGKHFLTKRPDGRVRCTACMLCATNCPAECITIEAAESDDKTIEKYPKRFEIDALRCVFCGYCEEACPVDAIRLGPEFAMADTDGHSFIWTKEELMNRPELRGGLDSVKPEEHKHPQAHGTQKATDPLRTVTSLQH